MKRANPEGAAGRSPAMDRRAFLALGGVAAAGCSPAVVLNALAPDGLAREAGLAYGEGPSRRLDVYAPPAAGGPRPVVVFFYGGSWQNGKREDYRFAGAALAAEGFVAMVPDYRKYPEVRFPGFVEDGAAAVAWARREAARFGGDPAKLWVMGHSAGAHIAALLALDAGYLAPHGMAPSSLAGLVGLAGPYDFLPLSSETLKRVFSPEAVLPRSQPVNFAGPGAPPAFLATGKDDTTVLPRNTVNLAARLRAAGRPVVERHYPSLNHYTLVGSLGAPLRSRHPVLDDVAAFIRSGGEQAG